MPGIFVLGFGGHARSVGDVAISAGVANLVFVDVNARQNERFLGFPVVRELPESLDTDWSCFPASGSNTLRKEQIESARLPLCTLVAASATVSEASLIGSGTMVGHHAHIGPNARIGKGVIVNTGAIVEHDCKVADFCHVSVNATIAGNCDIGTGVFIGAGATVIDGVSICGGVTVGAGATVTKDIEVPGTYVGTPAQLLNGL